VSKYIYNYISHQLETSCICH